MAAVQIAGAVAGATVGDIFGGPLGAIKGAAVGYELGGTVQAAYFSKGLTTSGPRLGDLTVQISSYGEPIPKIYGRMRVAGNAIWMQNIQETASNTSTGGKGGGGEKQTTTNYSYSITMAIAICEGPIDGILQVWADSELLTSDILGQNLGNYNVYLGSETQEPDPIMESYEGAGNVPAYRGIAYVVLQDFPLADYGNRIPNFTFEVKRTVTQSPSLEDQITAVNLIPGAGEFVYDTTIEKRTTIQTLGTTTIAQQSTAPVNMHNSFNEADVLQAQLQLQQTLPACTWINLVVCWFATSTDAGSCEIIPKVEAQGNITTTPDAWSVAGYTRATAQMVNTFPDGSLTYGGTPDDQSVLNLLVQLKASGFNVVFYPMIFVDTITPEPKPWRGRITPANATDAANWFTKTNGYNNFIEHYMNLSINGVALKDNIAGFIIGTEYVGMTSATFATGVYPAVTGFQNVAATAKSILPSGVKVIYAADWSEYHHTDGGWYNMDPLWADSNLDIVGIDAYFPLTPDLPQSDITYQDIYNGWTSGEGWDYYWDDTRTVKTSFTGFAYAWKNFPYWWENTHTNPNGSVTAWTAKMKPLWFTEIGFPSVDGCSNQPNVFVDPTSSESAYPRGSLQQVDFAAQRLALQASMDYLTALNTQSGNSNLVPLRFIWTWDARPYPYYPDFTNVWADGDLWITGHWIEGKLGLSGLGAIVASLLSDIGITNYDVSALNNTVQGYVINQIVTIRNVLQELQGPYFFDMVESGGVLKFVPRGQESVVTITQDNIVPPSGSGNIRSIAKITRTQELDLPQLYSLSYYNQANDYETNSQIAQRQVTSAINQVNVTVNLSLDDQTAQNMVNQMLYTSWVMRNSFEFTLPPQYAYLEPTDVITLAIDGVNYIVRITDSQMQVGGSQAITAVSEDVSSYDFYMVPGSGITNQTLPQIIPTTQMDLLDLPAFPNDQPTDAFMTIADAPLDPNWSGALCYRSDDGGESGGNVYNLISQQTTSSVMGVALAALGTGTTYTWDYENTIQVALIQGQLTSSTMLGVLNGANSMVIGGEIIQFVNATLISTNVYELSVLLRGRLGTEDQVGNHVAGDSIVLLDNSITRLSMPINRIGLLSYYKPVSVGSSLAATTEQSFTYNARQLKPYSPVQITGSRDSSGNLTMNWLRRTRIGGDLLDGVDVPLNEQTEAYQIDVLNGTTVVRTIAVTSPTCSYSTASQVSDFGSAQSSVSVNVYQMSAAVGRGIAGSAVV